MKKETIRKLGIALAAILGPGALLYLSGLVAQLQINYEDWLHMDKGVFLVKPYISGLFLFGKSCSHASSFCAPVTG